MIQYTFTLNPTHLLDGQKNQGNIFFDAYRAIEIS